VPARGTDQLPRLPIDRVFTIKGFAPSSRARWPRARSAWTTRRGLSRGLVAKIRGLQSTARRRTFDGGAAHRGESPGLERAAVERGDVIGMRKLSATALVDVVLEILHDAPRPLKSRDRVRLHTGTSEIMARALLLDGAELAPGKRGSRGCAWRRRSSRWPATASCPLVLADRDHRRRDAARHGPAAAQAPARLAHLNVLEAGAPEAVVEEHVRGAGIGAFACPRSSRACRSGRAHPPAPGRPGAAGRVTAVERDWSLHADAVARLRGSSRLRSSNSTAPNRCAAGCRARSCAYVRPTPTSVCSPTCSGRSPPRAPVHVDRDKVRLARTSSA